MKFSTVGIGISPEILFLFMVAGLYQLLNITEPSFQLANLSESSLRWYVTPPIPPPLLSLLPLCLEKILILTLHKCHQTTNRSPQSVLQSLQRNPANPRVWPLFHQLPPLQLSCRSRSDRIIHSAPETFLAPQKSTKLVDKDREKNEKSNREEKHISTALGMSTPPTSTIASAASTKAQRKAVIALAKWRLEQFSGKDTEPNPFREMVVVEEKPSEQAAAAVDVGDEGEDEGDDEDEGDGENTESDSDAPVTAAELFPHIDFEVTGAKLSRRRMTQLDQRGSSRPRST